MSSDPLSEIIPGVIEKPCLFHCDRYMWYSVDDTEKAWNAGLRTYTRIVRGSIQQVVVTKKEN